MGKAGKTPSRPSSSSGLFKRSKNSISDENRANENENTNDDEIMTAETTTNQTMEVETTANGQDDDWRTANGQRLNKTRKMNTSAATINNTMSANTTQQGKSVGAVHSYFSFGENKTKPKPKPNCNPPMEARREQQQPEISSWGGNGSERRTNAKLPPFKLEFEDQQKPLEIQVLNDMVKKNYRLNVSSASYSTHPHSRHVLLLFANDTSTYEMLFEKSSWPDTLCGLKFHVSVPNRIPTSYSILINRIPREWDVDSIRPLLIERYSSTAQVVRIFRQDGQPTTRIRVDLRSNEEVQKIIRDSHIYIDSIRYPATPYKPLARIDRCYRCQQYGHKSGNCENKPKCYKCGEEHQYNRDCTNTIKCANCSGQHMAGAPECPVKISYRKEQRNQQQATKAMKQPTVSHYLPSPARLYSTVLQTIAPLDHTEVEKRHPQKQQQQKSTTRETQQSFVIIETLKQEIGRSQDILLEKIMQLEQKCEAVHQLQAALRWTIETQIVPYTAIMSELLVDIGEKLIETQIIKLSEQQKAKLCQLRLTPIAQMMSTLHSLAAHIHPSPPVVNQDGTSQTMGRSPTLMNPSNPQQSNQHFQQPTHANENSTLFSSQTRIFQ